LTFQLRPRELEALSVLLPQQKHPDGNLLEPDDVVHAVIMILINKSFSPVELAPSTVRKPSEATEDVI